MKKIIALCSMLFVFCFAFASHAADEKFLSCGPGYVLANVSKIEGITAYECQKLWCRDLENGKSMGSGNTPASGYKSTSAPVELCDAKNNCIECFGDRRWCSGDTPGVWNPEYGAYTRGGADTATYVSVQKSSCFGWQLEKPDCASGETAVLQNGEWVCVTSSAGSSVGGRPSTIRRTGTVRGVIR